MKSLKYRLMSTASAAALSITSLPAVANPLGGQVVAGSATITGETTNQVMVDQSTEKAIVDWNTFDLAPGDTTQFVQPDAAAITLNRITGGLGASQIDGMINANGGVYVVNPDGILFGKDAVINTNSFLGTTHDIANSDFMAGNLNFDISGNPSASIVNEGTITAANGGFAALVAPGVRNDGIITANLGTVDLSAGNSFTLDLYGDNLITLQPSDSVAGNVRDVATGQTLKSLVQNTGTLRADGGKVALTAVAAKQVLDSVINSSGTVEADTVGIHKGQVIFGAATARTKPAGTPKQTVKVSGKITTKGVDPGTSGGKIQITGEDIQLADATLDASGQNGGGTIIVGGDFKGGDPTAPAVTMFGQQFETSPIPTATTVIADRKTTLDASATRSGNGGKIVVWADDTTTFPATVRATGGTLSGNGGFAEVSGKNGVDFTGIETDLGGQTPGALLFDPDVENIDQATADNLAAQLNASSAAVYFDADTINVLPNVDILKTSWGSSTLALLATEGINIENGVTIGSGGGPLNLYFDADFLDSSLFPSTNPSTATVAFTQLPPVFALLSFGATTSLATDPDYSGTNIEAAVSSIVGANLGGATPYVAQLVAADLTVAPTARFYLAGGSIKAFDGNSYFVGKTNFYSGPATSFDELDAEVIPSYGGNLLPLGDGVAADLGPDFGTAISFDATRRPIVLPGGMVSEEQIPGIGPIDFATLFGNRGLAPGNLTADSIFDAISQVPMIDLTPTPIGSNSGSRIGTEVPSGAITFDPQTAIDMTAYFGELVRNEALANWGSTIGTGFTVATAGSAFLNGDTPKAADILASAAFTAAAMAPFLAVARAACKNPEGCALGALVITIAAYAVKQAADQTGVFAITIANDMQSSLDYTFTHPGE